MKPFEAYQIYVAMKLHFNSDRYDIFKANGKTRASRSAFEKRRDKTFFFHLARLLDKHGKEYLIPLFLDNPNMWVGDTLHDRSEEIFWQWQKRLQSMTYNFKNDIECCVNRFENFNELFRCEDGQMPALMWMVMHYNISIETFIIMNKVLNFFPQFDKDIAEPIVWNELRKKCLKYEPFLGNIDEVKYKNIMRDYLCKNTSSP